MGYLVKKTYSTYDPAKPEDNVLTSDRLDYIQNNGLSWITNANGDRLDLTSNVRVAYNIPSADITNYEKFNVQYRGKVFQVIVDMYNKAYMREDDNGRVQNYLGTLTPSFSGVDRNYKFLLEMYHTGASTEKALIISVVGGTLEEREYIAKSFTIEAEGRNTYVDYASQQTAETYWNWWARPVGDPLNNRRTQIHKVSHKPHTYSVSPGIVYENHIVGTYASWALVSQRNDDLANNTLRWSMAINVGVNNVAGEQGLIAGIYGWDVKFNASDILDKEPTP